MAFEIHTRGVVICSIFGISFSPQLLYETYVLCMLDFFRSNCSWYISGITKGNDRSQSIPSRTYDLWPARPFVIVVVYHTTHTIHKMNNRVLYYADVFFCFILFFLEVEWKSWSSKQCSYLMNQKKDKSLKVGSSHLLLDIYGKLH